MACPIEVDAPCRRRACAKSLPPRAPLKVARHLVERDDNSVPYRTDPSALHNPTQRPAAPEVGTRDRRQPSTRPGSAEFAAKSASRYCKHIIFTRHIMKIL